MDVCIKYLKSYLIHKDKTKARAAYIVIYSVKTVYKVQIIV